MTRYLQDIKLHLVLGLTMVTFSWVKAITPEERMLLRAVCFNDLKLVERFLKQGISPNFYYDSAFIGYCYYPIVLKRSANPLLQLLFNLENVSEDTVVLDGDTNVLFINPQDNTVLIKIENYTLRLNLDPSANLYKEPIFWPGGPLLCGARSAEMADLLIHYGAKINGKGGKNPLNQAIEKGFLDVVSLLISEGARINTFDKNGMSPLATAIKYDYPIIVGWLLRNKALFSFLFIPPKLLVRPPKSKICALTREEIKRFKKHNYSPDQWKALKDILNHSLENILEELNEQKKPAPSLDPF